MKQIRMVAVSLAALALGWPAGAVSQKAGSSGRPTLVEPRADEVLRTMSEHLASVGRFAFEAEETFDELPDGEPRIQLTNVRWVGYPGPQS